MNQMTADTVIRGGPILTLDPRRPAVGALAIQAGRITRSGTSDEIAPLIGGSTQIIELRGRTVVPGFIDAHTHMGLGSFPAHQIIEVGLPKDGLLAKLASEAQKELDLPLVLIGWFPFLYDGIRDELDAVSTTRPILVMALDGHAMWLNSAAIRWLCIDSAPPPSPADEAWRDSNGRLTGLFRGAGWTVWIRNKAAEMSLPTGVAAAIEKEVQRPSEIDVCA